MVVNRKSQLEFIIRLVGFRVVHEFVYLVLLLSDSETSYQELKEEEQCDTLQWINLRSFDVTKEYH